MALIRFFIDNHAEVLELTLEHLWLVGIAMLLATLSAFLQGSCWHAGPGSRNPFWPAPTSWKPSPAWRFLDSFCRSRGSGNAPTAWRSSR